MDTGLRRRFNYEYGAHSIDMSNHKYDVHLQSLVKIYDGKMRFDHEFKQSKIDRTRIDNRRRYGEQVKLD